MSFILAAGSLSKLVLATDCSDANIEDLTEMYMVKSEHEIPPGLRWFYCAGLGIALLCMGASSILSIIILPNPHLTYLIDAGIISLCHTHKEASGSRIRIKKRIRLTHRFFVCTILFCLPLAHWLSSLQLISTTTGLVCYVLLLELWGMSCPDESFFGEKKACRYSARCKMSKKDLESAVKGGHVIEVSMLSAGGEKVCYFLLSLFPGLDILG